MMLSFLYYIFTDLCVESVGRFMYRATLIHPQVNSIPYPY